MFSRRIAAVCSLTATSAALASVTISVDVLDSSDGGNQPPANIVCVDVFVDVTPDDTWTAGGVLAFAQNGATFRYAHDPNTGLPVFTNPGTENRFVTFLSRPRARDEDARYTNGRAAIAGGFPYQRPIAEPFEVSVSYFASPPETIGSPSVDGYVFRIAIEWTGPQLVAGTGIAPLNAVLISRPLEGTTDRFGTAEATFDVPELTGLNWYLAPIPEPASLTVLALGIPFVTRRRNSA